MRTLTVAIATMLLLPASAAAKSGIVLSSTPDGVTAGQKWQVTLVAIRNDGPTILPPGARPAIRIKKQGSGERHTFYAHRQTDRSWLATVVFPSDGTWTYDVSGMGSLGAHQSWDPVTILRSPTASGESASHTSGGGFSLGWIAAASPIMIALGLWFEHWRRSSRRAELTASARRR
jgi:hypothetical protein